MNEKTFSLIAGVVFGLVALMHLMRILRGWDIIIGGWIAPMWASGAALALTGILCYYGLRFGSQG